MPIDPRNVLVIATPVMGDVLLSTPLVRSVKTAWPDASIDVLTRPGGAAVLEGNPDVHRCVELHKKPPLNQLAAFLFRRFRKYDLVLSNSASDRAFIYSLVMGKHRASLAWSLHSNVKLKQRLYDHWTIIDEDRYHTIPQNLKLVEPFGIDKYYDVTLPRAADAEERLRASLGQDWKTQAFAVLHPDTAAPIKRWHRQGWHELARYLHDRGLRVLVTGGPTAADRQYVEDVLGQADSPAESLAGKLRLGDVSVLLEHAALYIGVDTLVSHIAAAAGTPTVCIFGPSNPAKWGPWPKGWRGGDTPWRKIGTQRVGNVTIVQGVKQCAACGEPDYVKRVEICRKCLDTLTSEPLITAIEARLDDRGEPQSGSDSVTNAERDGPTD